MQQDLQRLDVLLGQIEVRHQLLHALGGVYPRVVDLVEGPVLPGLLDVRVVTEEQLLQRFRAESRQLDADPGFLLHPGDVVATGATVLPYQLLAPGDVGGLLETGHQLGVGLRLGAQGHQVGGEGQRLVFGQPQARHPGAGIVALGIAQPVVGPAGIHLGGDVLQVRHQILAGDAGGELALGKAVTPLTPQRAGQLLALLDHGRVAGPVTLGRRMLLEPCVGFLAGSGPQVGCRRQCLVFLEVEMRHTGMGPERARVQNPLDHPARIDLGARLSQTRSHLGDVIVAFDQVAAGTTHLLEDLLSPSHHFGALEALDVEVAGNAVGLHVLALEQRMLPELHGAVGLGQAVDALSLSVMAGGAAEDPAAGGPNLPGKLCAWDGS